MQAQEQFRELNETFERRVADAVAERRVLADIVEAADVLILGADMDFRLMGIKRAGANALAAVYGVHPKVGSSLLDLLADTPGSEAEVRTVWARALAGESYVAIQEFGDEA